MLAADTAVEVGANALTKLDCCFHKLTNTCLVKLCKRVVLKDFSIVVSVKELTCVISRETVSELCQVVCTEAEELGILRDSVSCKCRSRNLNHCTYFVLKLDACVLDFLVSGSYNKVFNILKLFVIADERNHNFGLYSPVGMSLFNIDSRTDNSLCLHLCDFGICYCKTAATVSHHRVKLVQRVNHILDFFNSLTLCLCESGNISLFGRNKFVERRIKESDCYGVTLKSLIKLFKVALLHRKNLIKSFFSFFNRVRANHLTESSDSVALKKHMLCAAKTDALCAKLSCLLCVSGSVGVCSYFKLSVLVGPAHNSAEVTAD